MRSCLEPYFEVVRTFNWVEVIRRNFFKPKPLVKGSRCFHVIQGIEQQAVIAGHAGQVHDLLCQLPSQSQASEFWAHKQAFHFTGIGVVHGI